MRRLAIALVLIGVACADPIAPTRQSPELQAGLLAPSLLVCPDAQYKEAEKVVDALGGTVSAGSSRISLPAGALLSPVNVKVRVPASDLAEIRITAGSQEHFTFEQPVSVTIDYAHCGLGLLDPPLVAWEIDPVTKAPLRYMAGVDNRLTQTLTFATTHLSGYALAE